MSNDPGLLLDKIAMEILNNEDSIFCWRIVHCIRMYLKLGPEKYKEWRKGESSVMEYLIQKQIEETK